MLLKKSKGQISTHFEIILHFLITNEVDHNGLEVN